MIAGCVNAYMNLDIRNNGEISPCCMSRYRYRTDRGSKNLSQESIIKFWNSDDRKKLISKLDNGIKISACSSCWAEEAAGKESKRIRDNKIFQETILDRNMLPLVISLELGNRCNIKCRICSSKQSTTFAAENIKIIPKPFRFMIRPDQNQIDSFLPENDYFWNDILELLPNVTKFDFSGGEPLLIEHHWTLIKQLVDRGWSKRQRIHYNTNGTIFPSKYVDLLKEFETVDIQISTDGIGKRFEYLRHGAKWDKVERNLNRFIEAKFVSSNRWEVGVCISISAFNVWYMFETFEYYAQKQIGIYINVVHDRSSVGILPTEIKVKIVNHLRSFESKYDQIRWVRERDMICNYLENSSYSSIKWLAFRKELEIRDKIRNESFEQTFPEFDAIIKEI